VKNIELYKTESGETQIKVRFEKETVWLSLNQMAELFGRDKSVISRHLKNIFSTDELNRDSVVAKNATTASDGKTYQVKYYNLDAIISVGYRVNSKQGTQFRIWATKRLKEYLIQGYSINGKRLNELNQLIKIIEKSEPENATKQINESKGLLHILKNYTKSFILLNRFDSNSLELNNLNTNLTYQIEYSKAKNAIYELKSQLIDKNEATELFGNEIDKGFSGILKSVIQTFDGTYLYSSVEEQAAHLLYFIIKNHPFTDGNKRIGAFLFVWFLEKNKHLLNSKQENKINENALTAIALLVAQSNPSDKDLMIKLICNLIN